MTNIIRYTYMHTNITDRLFMSMEHAFMKNDLHIALGTENKFCDRLKCHPSNR